MPNAKKNYKIVEKFKYFLIIALVVVLTGVGFAIARGGMNIGIDFSGGVKIEVEFDTIADDAKTTKVVSDEMKKVIADNGFKIMGDVQVSGMLFEARLEYNYNGEKVSADEESSFIVKVQGDGTEKGLNEIMLEALTSLCEENETLKACKATLADENGVTAYTVGATASGSLLRNAIIALCVAIVCMLVYIVIRFTFASALAAVCALCHDVLIMVAFTSIFNIPVNSTFIAAVITIVGYSINATIIIFDCIREDIKNPNNADKTDAELANAAIVKTVRKTILTTVTTLVMLLALAVFSVNAIQDFIYPIIFGLFAGAFSSVLLAPAMWTVFRKVEKKNKAKKAAKKGYQGAVASSKDAK